MTRFALTAATFASLAVLPAAALPAAALPADAQPAKQAIVPEGMEWATEDFGFSPAVRAGDFVYLAGVVAGVQANEDGTVPELVDAQIEQAFEQAFDNIATVLEAAGASWDDVAEMTTFHTDMPDQIQIFMRVKDRYVKEPFPAWTAIDIDRLYPDGGLVEIKVVAYAPQAE